MDQQIQLKIFLSTIIFKIIADNLYPVYLAADLLQTVVFITIQLFIQNYIVKKTKT